MKYIDELKKVANDEVIFSQKLIEVKTTIQNEKNSYKEMKLLLRNLKKYCDNRLKDTYIKDKDIFLLDINDFCMFVSERILSKIENIHKLKKQVIQNITCQKTFPKEIEDKMKMRELEDLYRTMDICFPVETEYRFDKVENDTPLKIVKCLLENYNYNLLYKLTGVNPIILVAESGEQEANITRLGLILLIIDTGIFKEKESDIQEYILSINANIINNLVESSMCILMEEVLTDSDIMKISNTYNIKKEDLKFEIGKDVSLCLTNPNVKYTNLLKCVLEISEQNRKPENRIIRASIEQNRRVMDRMY